MKQNVARLAALTCITLIVALFGPALFLGGGAARFGCPLAVNAQDNPCLAQDATISALQNQVGNLQSTLTNINLEATITALQAQSNQQLSTGGEQAQLDASMFFTETFDNNDRGWELYSNPESVARLSRGQLLLIAGSSYNNDYLASVQIPNLDADTYYIEAEVTMSGNPTNYGFFGFIIGDLTDTGSRNYILVGQEDKYDDWTIFVAERDVINNEYQRNPSTTLGDRNADLWSNDVTFTIAGEMRNGTFTLYLNGEMLEGFTPSYGTQIGFVTFGNISEPQYSVDNVIVRQTR